MKDSKEKVENKNENKKERGASYVGVTVTVIVAVIIVMVAIFMIAGTSNNSSSTGSSSKDTEESKDIDEQKEMANAYFNVINDGNEITADNIREYFEKNDISVSVEDVNSIIKVTFSGSGNVYELETNGTITSLGAE